MTGATWGATTRGGRALPESSRVSRVLRRLESTASASPRKDTSVSNYSSSVAVCSQSVRRSRRYKDKSPGPQAPATSAMRPTGWPKPKHVRECWNRRNSEGGRIENQNWWIWSWRKGSPELKSRRPYSCGSWRCEGKCATHAAHVLFSRLDEATKRECYSDDGWVFAVLTLDRYGTRGGRKWSSVRDAFVALGSMSERVLKRWRRMCERSGWSTFGSDWAMVVESHRSGWPHANLMLYCPEMAEALAAETKDRELAGYSGRERVICAHVGEPLGGGIRGVLGRHIVECGWGIESTVERCDSVEALSGYLVKLSRHPDRTLGEIAKLTQLPLGAPFRFRRLRSGKGFLPKVRKNSEYTGALVKRVRDNLGCRDAIVPVPKHGHSAERLSVVSMVERLELFILSEEDRAAWQMWHGRPVSAVSVSPVSIWMNEVLQRDNGPPNREDSKPSWDDFRAMAYRLSLPLVDASSFVQKTDAVSVAAS